MPSRNEAFACATLLLVVLAAMPADAGFCLNTGARQAGSRSYRVFKTDTEDLKNTQISRCPAAHQKCIECVHPDSEIQSYVAFCSEYAATYTAYKEYTCVATEACKTKSESSCHPQMSGIRSNNSCPHAFSVDGVTDAENLFVYCTGACGTAVIYLRRKVYAMTSCSKHSREWLESYKKNNTNVISNFCDKSINCTIETSVIPKWATSTSGANGASGAQSASVAEEPKPAPITTAQVGAGVVPVVPQATVTVAERTQKTSARSSSASNAGTAAGTKGVVAAKNNTGAAAHVHGCSGGIAGAVLTGLAIVHLLL